MKSCLCRSAHTQYQSPQVFPENPSNALWNSTRAEHTVITSHRGKKIAPARKIIAVPSALNVMKKIGSRWNEKFQATCMMVYSAASRKAPRLNRNHAKSLFVLPRPRERNAPVPARNMNRGAQKCVIQRVKNNAGNVVCMF